MPRREKILLIVAVLTVLFIAAVLFVSYFIFYIPQQQEQAAQNLREGRNLFHSGNALEAIPQLQQALQQATTPAQKAQAELSVAASYVEVGMVSQGTALRKEISLNQTYPVLYRLSAAEYALEWYISAGDMNYAIQNLFTGPIWGDFIKGNTTDTVGVNAAVKNAYLWVESLAAAASIGDLPFRLYWLTNWYAQDALSTSTSTREEDIVQAKRYLMLGDSAYASVLEANAAAKAKDATSAAPFSDTFLAGSLSFKARALSGLYQGKVDGITFASPTDTFMQAIGLYERKSSDKVNLNYGLYARFNLALFLAKDDAVNNKQEILTILGPLYTQEQSLLNFSFYHNFLRSTGVDPTLRNSAGWNNIGMLAKIDPRLKTMLVGLGWNAADIK